MKPVKPPGANFTWQMPEEADGGGTCEVCGGNGSEECPGCWGSGRRGDLPVVLYRGADGEPDASVSLWKPDDGERRALLNGAPVELRLIGMHPPTAVNVGEPTDLTEGFYTQSHVSEAVPIFVSLIGNAGAPPTDPEEAHVKMMGLWEQALRKARPEGTSVMGRGRG